MKSADAWLSEYSETHQNPVNQKIHRVCVPAIFWSVVTVLALSPWTSLLMIPALIFYFRLGWRLGFVMLGFTTFSICISLGLQVTGLNVLLISTLVFIIAWIGQFYGHHIEGKKPSFLQDLLFLLIGPLWTLKKYFPKLF